MIAAVTVMFVPAPAAQADGTTTVDPDTTNVWSDIAASSTNTQNIGRIWTDKSVFDENYTFKGGPLDKQTVGKGNSDFLVGLSALSSTSNLKTTTTTTTPLDIVLVLDQSGSMGDSFGGSGSGTRRAALQEAAKTFINATEESNQGLDQSQQHRISIVTFDSGSSVSRGWTYVSGNGADQLRSTVDGLSANGATRVDLGMDDANDQLNSARQGAMKVVIVFTDGDPTSGSSFENEVAADAINTAHTIKQDKGATVYTIGIFSGANPNTDNKANNYMNAMSSNYPTATAVGENPSIFDWSGEFSITWGDGSRNDGYYKSATNSEELNKVFEEISEDITTNAGSGSPIEEVTHEGALNPGTLTFTDELGSYMEVSGGTMTVVYGDWKFTSTNKTTADNVDTYHFEGTVAGNAVYKEADLADLTVTVTHGDTLAAGDKVTVQIPASLIPMRNYDVDTDAKTMKVSDAYPIRLFFGVSVKDAAEKAIEQGSGDVYDAIVKTNKTDDGKVAFYSNLYNSGSGDTTATFTPSDGNKFYYYTQDTDLYVDQNCTQRATTENIDRYETLYYSEPYWEITSGNSAQEVTRGIAIDRDGQDWKKMTPDGQGNYYILAGTQRLDRPASLNSDKVDENGKPANNTGTATTVLTPSWEGTGVTQRLGNNGKITYDLPGELEIKKSVDWGNASDDTKQNQNSFEFTVNFNGKETLDGNFAYDVYESGEEPVDADTVADGGTITLKDGQRAVIKGLPSGTTFTVTETGSNENGFTTTDTVTADPNNDTTDGIANGTIVGGSRQYVSFQNNYKADEPLTYNVSDDLNVQKILDGRDWRDGDEFTFNVQALDGYAPTQPEVTIGKDTPDHKASFGTITFDKDGEFRYVVREDNDMESPIAGIGYSNATYRLTVKVVDAGNGELKVESAKLEMFQDDTGAEKNPAVAVEGATATFTNYYLSDQGTINIDGKKAYDDTTGDNPIAPNKFQFQMEALGGYVTDGGSRGNLTVSADDTPKPPENTQGNVTTIGNVGNEFHMPTINFDGNDVGNTYVYKITEVKGSEAGMTYDENSYEIEVKVTEDADPESEDGHVHIVATANKTPEQLTFTNTYEPTAAKLEGDNAIHGTKTLEGRQMKEGETFYFQLSALNDNAKTVLADPETVTVTDQNAMDFRFSEKTFTKVGTYTFQVNEVADDKGTETTNADGMTFDTNIATVTVTVTDGNDSDDPADHGKLLASVSYSNDKHSNVTDHAQFTNVYKANMNYGAGGAGGIAVTKTMVDRTMDAGDYNFTLTGTGPDGEITETFENTPAAANGTVTMKQLQNLTFDEQDAEKTFTFTVDEADPTDENRLPGVEYDQSQYRVDITVHDNHDGNMYTETTVTKIKNADGTEANEIVVGKLNSSTAQGQVPTFGFTNTYKPTEASLDGGTALKVTKKVTGAASPDGVNYTFTLTAQNTADGPIANIGGLNGEGKLTVSTDRVIAADSEQTQSFDKLTFSKPGTYTFTVQENQPTATAGWTFDDADGDGVTDTHAVTVVVSDLNKKNEYDGALHIKSVTPNAPTLITNSYKADPVIVGGEDAKRQITVQKSVAGADSDAEFKFEIEPVIDDDHTQQWWQDRVKGTDGFSPQLTISGVTQAQAMTKAFAGIQFNAVGEYKFNVTEVGAADFNAGADRKGWTYDAHTATVTVTVTDKGNDGQLDAEVSYDNTSATTTADQGVGNAAAFTNKYEAGSSTLTGSSTTFNGSKTVTGRDWLDGESFGFTMKPVEQEGVDWSSVTYKADDSSKPVAVGENTATATENGGETVPFWFPGSYTFTKAGTYTFNVTETQHNGKALPQDDTNGMTYDRHTGVITVTVKDNGEGQLVATPKYEKMTFENKYEAEPATWGFAADELLGGHKYINDTTGNTYTLEADQFSFTMRAQAVGNPMPEGWDANAEGAVDNQGRGMMTVTNGTGNTSDINVYDFGWIEFTHDDMAGATAVEDKPGVFTKTFQYNIFETGTMPAGISRDNTAYTVTFTVTEDHNTGKITVATPTATKIVEGSGGAGDPVDVTKLDFTNTYNPDSIEGHQNFFKTLSGRNWQKGDTFTFKVSMTATQTDGTQWPANAPLPSVKATDGYKFSDIKTNDAGNGLDYTVTINPESLTGNTYRFDTGTITYEREGIYTWTVFEQKSTVDHVTSDSTVYTVKVTVTDEGGVLKRSVQVTGGNYTDHDGDQTLDFTNVYKPNEVTTDDQGGIGNIQVTKKVEGNATSAAFNFKLTLENGDAANVLTNKDDPQSAFPADGITKATSGDFADGDTKAVDFGALTFTAEGDYTFKVVETDDAPANWTYANRDADAKTITIHVTDPDNGGQLVASYDKEAANNPTFTNSYKAEGTLDGDAEGAKNLMVTKTIDGRKFQKDDTFSFQLTADKNNPAGATLPKNADGLTIAYADGDDTNSKTAAFGDITFTLPGTYTFHVSEKVPADAGKLGGMTYSDEQYTVTVEVTDAQDGNGKLDAVITKIVNKSGDEVDGLAFTNTYEPGGTTDLPETGEGSIQLRKVLTGKAWDGDEFKFQLTAKGATTPDGSGIADVPMPGVAEKTISDKTGTEDGNDYADFGFGSITYSQAGTYVYEVTEIPGGNAGISYDGHTATVTVSVVDNLHGGFTATASVANGTFTNVYKSELDYQAAGGLEIAKTFENADMREFSFTVKPADQASADKLGIKLDGETLTTTPGATIGDDNASHATVSIGAGTDVTFTQADADKTYTYTVQENVGSNAGVNYDGTVYTVTITTVDDGQGGIQVTTTVADAAGNTQSYVYDNDDATDDQPAVIPFTNTYTATGELGGNGSTSIKATKTLTNRPMTDGEFTFNVTNAADPAGTVVATGTNAADGTITFGAIDYSIDQMMKDVDNGLATPSVVDDKNTFTYQYTVAEDQASFDEGVTAIAGSFGITVTVTDNGDGTLGIAVTYPDGGDGLTFRNAYGEGEQGQATLNIAGEKKLDVQSGNNAPNIAGKYTFTLTGEDGAPMPDTTTATNDAAGNVTFGDVTYTMENVFGDTGDDGTATLSAQRTRTFTYTVTESGAVDGVANDPEASKTFTVTVTDNGDGTLSAVSDPAQGAKFSFTNTYSVKPTDSSATGKGGITVTKKLTGRDLQDGEFSFELVDHNGQKVAEGTNDADGNVELGAVTFTEPGDYVYTIREVNTALASVDYDAAEYAVTATVTDNGDGTLSVTWKLDGDAPATFTNTYDPVDASVVIGASKVLDGRELKDGEFTFQLTGADESTPMPEDAKDGVATATNAANGSIGFGTIVYDQAGTYKYTVSEVNDKQDGVTYDDTTYEVTVTVTDNTAEGRLEATVDYGDATALVFTNTYKKAEATIPKTGAAVILPSVIGFILLLGASGMYASKRRKRS